MAQEPPSDFIPIRLGTLRPGDTLGFDVFVKVADRFVKHTLAIDSLDQDRLKVLKEKGVRKVFIPLASEAAYLHYLDTGLDMLRSGQMPTESKVEMAQSALASIAGDAAGSIESAEAFNTTGARVRKISEFLVSDKNIVNEFLKTSGVSKDIAQHSATVSMLALAVAAKVGIKDQKDLLELGLAALLHDYSKDAKYDWTLPPDKHSEDQTVVYLSHAVTAAEELGKKAFVSQSIRDLVRDHEEIGKGQGFPEKKNIEKLPPLQQVLNLCNHYDSICSAKDISPLEAGRQFFIDKVGMFPLGMLTALSEIVNKK